MQGTLVRSLVREDPTCHGVNKPVLLILRSRVHVLQQEKRHSAKSLYTATRKQPPLARTGEGPAQPKINKYLKKKKKTTETQSLTPCSGVKYVTMTWNKGQRDCQIPPNAAEPHF